MASGYYDITNKTLGKGHYGVVKLGRHCLTGEPVAIKIIEKSRLNSDSLNQLGTEIRILFRLSEYEHPNILKLYQTIDSEEKLFLITEYCGPHACDLHDYLSRKHSRDGLIELEAQVFFIQICSAISYCHSMGIVHRDLKPENILVTDYRHMRMRTNNSGEPSKDPQCPLLKLIDFGFANQWSADEKMRTSCGTLAYSAPELLLGEPYDGAKVDVWGLGLMLYILLYGGNPFMQINDNETLTRILDCSFATPSRDNVNNNAIELLKSLIKRNPDTRLPIDAILRHKWFSNIPKTFELPPSYRINPDHQPPVSNSSTITNVVATKSMPKLAAQILSPTTLPSISESGPLKNINRSVEDDHVVSDSISETSRPNYNRTRSLSITRTYTGASHQSSLTQTRSSNNLERLNYTPQTILSINSPKQQFTPLGSPLCRPTSPDVRGSVEPSEEEARLHEKVLKEIFRLTKFIDSKSSVEASLKNARFSHRQFDHNSIKPTQFNRRKLSTGLVSLLGQDKKDSREVIVSSPVSVNGDQPEKPDGKPCIVNTKLSNDDYIYATYQLIRDRILRYKDEKIRRQKNDDLECDLQECSPQKSSDTIPEDDFEGKHQDNHTHEISRQDRVSAKENDRRLQQRKLLQPQHKMRDKFTSFFRSGSTSPSGSSLPCETNTGIENPNNNSETHHDAFNDHDIEMSSSVARYIGSKTDTESSMAYALPLARKCSLVSEEGCSSEPQDNQ